jgi:hypothetical protein
LLILVGVVDDGDGEGLLICGCGVVGVVEVGDEDDVGLEEVIIM